MGELKKAPGKTFQLFLLEVDGRSEESSGQLRDIHNEVCGYVQEGDPIPFKTFRQNEYLTTIERMGCIYYRALASEVLQDEIVITHEVRE
ncbi:MAG: hypothetical protein WA996_26190, partial [Candidatus Promineifilaceae bacterium]